MTEQSSRSLLRRALGGAASGLIVASILLTPASALAAGGPGTPPTVVNDTINATEDAPITGNVLDNDINSSGVTPFTVDGYTQPAVNVGTIVIAANGDYTFTPAANFTGSGSATYTVSNTKHDNVGPGTITINVAPSQDPPVAGDDDIAVDEDTATNVKAAILANDNDPDGDTLSVTNATNATGGSVDLTGGAVTFTPNGNLCGDDAGSFDYTLSATGGTDTAHVTVDITCVDDAPVATDDDASGTEDQDVVVDESTLVGNDSDLEGDTLSVSAVSGAHGGSVSRAGGQVTFTPDDDLCGDNVAWFDYTLDDGNGGTDTGTVTIDLACTPDAPVATDDSASGTEDQDVVITASDLATNDDDADGDTLTVTDVGNAQGGSVSLDSGTVTFTPDANACGDGAGSFDYTVDDGNGGTDTGTVTVDLDCENDNPTANGETVSADEDTPADLTSDLLVNDSDVDGDTLSIDDFDNVSGGSVDLTGGVLTFTPDAGECGDAYGGFDYLVIDGEGGSAWATAVVDVQCSNDNPVANDDTASGTEDQPVTVDPADLTTNDTDADGDTLSVDAVGSALGGSVELDGGVVTFIPDANLCGDGAASFDYTVVDGNGGSDTGTVAIDLACENDNPDANPDTASGTEDNDVVIDAGDLTSNDSDIENGTLSVSDVGNAHGGTVSLDGTEITFTPDDDVCGDGAASFDYELSDGDGGTATGTVTIDLTCENDNPVATDDTASGTEDNDVVITATDLLDNDSDVDDGDTLSVDAVGNPSGGTVSLDAGEITFTPEANLCGDAAAWFEYTLGDGNGGTDTGTVWIDLDCENDGPIAHDDVAAGTEDTDLVIDVADLLANDEDIEGPLTVIGVSSPLGGTVSLDGTDVTFTPTANLCGDGAASFTYTVEDGDGASDFAVVVIDVTCTNDNPVATDDAATVNQNSGPADHVVLGNDSDIDGDTLTVTLATVSASAGTAGTDGTKVTFTPATNFSGLANVTYTVSDGHGGTDTATLAVTVDAVITTDSTPPTPAIKVAFGTGRVDTTAPLRISWSATDTQSGVDRYQVQVRFGAKPWANFYQGKGTSKGIAVAFRKQVSFRVRAWDSEGNRSTWVSTGARKVLPVQNLTTTVIKYKGGWAFVANRASSGGGYSSTTQLGSSASWTTNGLQIAYIAPKLATGGYVKVFIDGKLVGRYNLHQAGTAVGRVISRISLTAGLHTIKIVNDQAGKRTTLDAFLVLK